MSWIDDFFSRRYYQQVTIDRPDLVEYPKNLNISKTLFWICKDKKCPFFKEKRKEGKEKNESNEKRSVIDFVDSDKYIEH